MYQVFDNGKPADAEHQGLDGSWSNSKFDTLEEAQIYANHYLGFQKDILLLVELNVPYDYSGYGDFLEIRKVG